MSPEEQAGLLKFLGNNSDILAESIGTFVR
jgi:hypothetical protein